MPSRRSDGRRQARTAQQAQARERGEAFAAALADLESDRRREGDGTPHSRLLRRIKDCETLLDEARAAGHAGQALQALRLLDGLERQRTKLEADLAREERLKALNPWS
jgi:uncharacterized protein YicC (UPF0701 family)